MQAPLGGAAGSGLCRRRGPAARHDPCVVDRPSRSPARVAALRRVRTRRSRSTSCSHFPQEERLGCLAEAASRSSRSRGGRPRGFVAACEGRRLPRVRAGARPRRAAVTAAEAGADALIAQGRRGRRPRAGHRAARRARRVAAAGAGAADRRCGRHRRCGRRRRRARRRRRRRRVRHALRRRGRGERRAVLGAADRRARAPTRC